jgi:uncharacterized membrane protein YfcA
LSRVDIVNWCPSFTWIGVLHFFYEATVCVIAWNLAKLIGASYEKGGAATGFLVLVVDFAVLSTMHNIMAGDLVWSGSVLFALIAWFGVFVGSWFCHAAFSGDVLWQRHDPRTNRWGALRGAVSRRRL